MLILELGDTAPEVWFLKVWLNDVVRPSPNLPLDQPFGPNTKSAVAHFQMARGLTPDGVVDPMTWRELAHLAEFTRVPPVDPAHRPTQLYWPLYLRDHKRGKIDPVRFRSAFAKTFSVSEANKASGLEKLVQFINADQTLTQLQLMAYMLATAKWETSHGFEPRLEGGCQEVDNGDCPHANVNFYCKKKVCPNTDQTHYRKLCGITECPNKKKQHIYHGRGYIQLTLYDNYAGMEDRLGIKLVHYPENALLADNAYKILSSWCQVGPPKSTDKLTNHIGAHSCNYYNARNVVNTDKDKVPAGSTQTIGSILEEYAKKFEVCLAYGMGTFLG